jgi:hypothetical protein
MMKYDGVRKYSPARRDEITKTIEKLDASILPLE